MRRSCPGSRDIRAHRPVPRSTGSRLAERTSDQTSDPVAEPPGRVRTERIAPPSSKYGGRRGHEEVRPGDSPSGSKSDKAAFLPARSFSGWRHGYYFRLGDAGLGYYLDVGAEAAEAIARSRRDGARSHSPPSTSRHLEPPPPTIPR